MKLQEALGLIPDSNIAQRALELAVENSLNKDVPDCATALESGFLFPVTSEGAAYWRSVVDALRAGNDLPPLPVKKPVLPPLPTRKSVARTLDEWARVPFNAPMLPSYPEAPEGKMWEYVGEAVHGLLGRGMWASCNPRGPAPSWHVVNNGLLPSGGYRGYHYIKLVDAPTQCASQCAETCTPNPESGDIVQETAQTHAPLQLRVGGYYRRRDGKVVGPATTYDHPEYTIALASCIYPLNGVHVYPRFDIIGEITREQYNREPYNQERN